MSQTHTNGTRNPEIDEQLGEEEEQVAEEKNKLQRKKNKLTGKDQFRVRVTVYLSTITSRGLYIHQSHTHKQLSPRLLQRLTNRAHLDYYYPLVSDTGIMTFPPP